ncbi:MAG: uracil-DNA glycosylase [Halieaceae bacterium]|nr:uracil-DNA glycosylase [Halieaceae bacterium]
MSRRIQLEDSWLKALGNEFEQEYMRQLRSFLQAEKAARRVIYPPGPQIFNAFKHTPLPSVKVIILGQDPYHGPGQAHGLCFSVPEGIDIPPSLQNIYRELEQDLGVPAPRHGCLTSWAEQGVLLLNSVLSVRRGQAASHQGRGWEQFTDRVIAEINQQRQGAVFMLWGSYAQRKGAMVDAGKHLLLKAPHPSPLSAHRGFFGCRHFSRANDYLQQQGQTPVNWVP